MKRIALLGASRGLGWAVYSELVKRNPNDFFFLSSRKIAEKKDLVSEKTLLYPQDFSKTPVDSVFLNELKKFQPTHLLYCAGGGPYGDFPSKKWSDHQWALTTTFLFPAELLHYVMSQSEAWPSLEQIIFVGSAIAQENPDPKAASYAAAKHALKGLVSSVQQEGLQKPLLSLFSPGYMQTNLLPGKAWPKEQGLAEPVEAVANKLIDFIEKNNQR